MSLPNGIREAWSIVAAKPLGKGLRATPFVAGGTRVLATVTDDGCRGLLIKAPPEEKLGATVAAVARTTTALSAEVYPFTDDLGPARGLHIWCTRTDLLEAFVGFCEPFVLRIQGGEALGAAFLVCFEEFRTLIAAAKDLSIAPQFVGLLGELYVLTEVIGRYPGAIAFWPYPVLERHDFRHGSAALEVKTTLRSQIGRPLVTISALDQLEPPENGTLHLHFVRLEQVAGGSVSVLRLLEEIGRTAPPDIVAEVRARVLRDEHVRAREALTFEVQDRKTFHVGVGFPRLSSTRLISGAVDPGIDKVTYELDLSAAAAFGCSIDEAYRALLGGEYHA